MSCSICIEKFTKQPHRKEAKCPYCDIKACTTCTQTYLIGTHEDPHCMGCRRGWTREVLDTILLTTWINGDYKKRREDILFDRERSRLPAAQIIVERRKQAIERESIRTDLINRIREMEAKLTSLRNDYTHELQIFHQLQNGRDPFATGEKKPEEERRVFIMPCPASGCRGFLSTAYKCGVCEIYVCPDCREIKGASRDTEHTCNPDTVATVQRLKRECRGCPECGTNIFKIEGCDQMYCTNCNTPFSWISGKKITNGAIHNPHYFEYLRVTNGGVMPRNPGDIPCIANLPNAWQFQREVTRVYFVQAKPEIAEYADTLYVALNSITHIQHVEINRMTTRAEDSDNTEINVRYILGEIDQKAWKQGLQQKEKRRAKKDEIRMRYEAFVGACVDIYGRIMGIARDIEKKNIQMRIIDACKDGIVQLTALSNIFNEGMKDISRRYKCQVLHLDDKIKRTIIKYADHKRKVSRRKLYTSVGEGTQSPSVVSDSESEEEMNAGNVVVQT